MKIGLSGLFVWKDTVSLGYPCLESFLSIEPALDEIVICFDPRSDPETLALCTAIRDRYPSRVYLVPFVWPIGKTGDGSVIGQASQYGLDQMRTSHVLNIQADEIYPPPLMQWVRDNWRKVAEAGYDCLQFKVLHTEHNMQRFQGGDEWNGDKGSEAWRWQKGAGYNSAVKLFKHCPAVRFSHDGWSMEGCVMLAHVATSVEYPILHAHDMLRDHYIALRRNAADQLWTDQLKFGHYKASADQVEASRAEWWDDPIWTRPTSPFGDLLPDFAKPLIGQTHYTVNWSLLEEG